MTSSIAPTDLFAVTCEQDLLLVSALGQRRAAIEAWRAWAARVDIARLDRDSQWLLPLLYWNLRRHGVGADRLVRYRNVYLHHWYRNTVALSRLDGEAATTLAGGAAMAVAYYDSPGLRPFVDLEPVDADNPRFSREIDRRAFADGHCGHWASRPWRVLAPAHQVVDVIVRRDRWDIRSRLFWITDAVTLLRRPDLDVAVVHAFAAELGALDAVTAIVDGLRARFGGGV